MGIGALKIHLKGSYRANAKKIKDFFRSTTSPTSAPTLALYCHQPEYQGKVDETVTNSAVSEAEIWWTWNSVAASYSNLMLIVVVGFYQCFLTQILLRNIFLILISCSILSILCLVLISRTL